MLKRFGHVRVGIHTHCFHREFCKFLLNFGAADFQHADFGPRFFAIRVGHQKTKFGKLKRPEFDFELSDTFTEIGVFDDWASAGVFFARHLLEAAQTRFRMTDARNAGTFVAQQEFCVRPALVLLTNAIVGRNPNVCEICIVDLTTAVDGYDGCDFNTGRLHVDQQEGNTFLNFAFV